MEKTEKEVLGKRKRAIREKIDLIIKHKEAILLYCLIIFAIIFKLYYFFKTIDQAIWWDEGDYLAIAKEFIAHRPLPEWWSHFTAIRPLFMSFVWSFSFLIGLSEPVIRFLTLLIPSILTILLTYKIGKDLYNKNVGLIASAMLSVYWVHHFYTYRLLTDIPALFFGVLSVYFFWCKYITKKKNYGFYLSIAFGVIAFATRFPLALVIFSILLYLFITNGLKIFKDKTIWKGIGIGALMLSPYLVYFIYTKFRLFTFYFGEQAVSIKTPVWQAIKEIIPMIPTLLHSVWFIGLIVGIISLYKLFIGFDLVIKQKTRELNADLFVFLLAAINLAFYVFIIRAANDRWLLMFIFPVFLISAKGIDFIGNILKKYSKVISVIIVFTFVLWGMYQHIDHGHNLIISKVESYKEEKLAGLWLKENTPEDSKIIIASIVQNQYYSERQSYDFGNKNIKIENCQDLYGKLLETEECQTKTEKAFRQKVKDIDADYLVLHVFEPVFTPQWAYSYPQNHPGELTPLIGWADQNNNPLLVIYLFNKSAEIFN